MLECGDWQARVELRKDEIRTRSACTQMKIAILGRGKRYPCHQALCDDQRVERRRPGDRQE